MTQEFAISGYRTGMADDAARRHWREDRPRPIAWSAWYPCAAAPAEEMPQAFFDPGRIAPGAPLHADAPCPVILMSHGTGGTAEGMGWLARALAAQGFIVLAANHHGNCGLEPYMAEGFLCWWERAADLSVLLSHHAAEGPFAGHLDLNCVAALGFSLGAYTVLALAGARSDMALFQRWCDAEGMDMRGPREFPDAADQIDTLMKDSSSFRAAWERQSSDFTDPRISNVIAIAAPPPVRAFTPASVQAITRPVTLITGVADREAPNVHCSDWLQTLNPAFTRHDLGAHVGHYRFLDFPQDRSLIGRHGIFTDHPSVQRADIHARTLELILETLA